MLMLAELQPLVWIIVGFLLIVSEFFATGLIVVFFGTAAIATGLLIWIGLPTSHGIPFFVFTLLTLGQIYFLRGVLKEWFHGTSIDQSRSAHGDDEFLGREATVVSGFEEGSQNGRVAFRGTQWTARSSEPLQNGDLVIIEGRDGHTLHVAKPSKNPAL